MADNGQYARYQYQLMQERIAANTRAAAARVAARDPVVDNANKAAANTASTQEGTMGAYTSRAPATTLRTSSLETNSGPHPRPVTNDTTRLTSDIPAANPMSQDPSQMQRQFDSSSAVAGENVLNKYRSVNYNFTLSGLEKSAFNTPNVATFESNSQSLKILSSAGKGSATVEQSASATLANADAIISGFNENSSGRFDMFIDNVEIDTIMAFNGKAGPTLPTAFRFEVYEPYSINGFLEALHTTAIAAGYMNYAEASYLLKMNFIGYPDGVDLPDIVSNVPNSTRYFSIKITQVQLDITEKGTRYICVGIPYNEYALSDVTNKLKQDIQLRGIKILPILEQFMRDLTEQRKKQTADSFDKNSQPLDNDEYKIQINGFGETFQTSNLGEKLKENQIFNFTPQQSAFKKNAYDPRNNKQFMGGQPGYDEAGNKIQADGTTYDPSANVINFRINSNITDCIAAVIVESEWHRKLLKNITVDPRGMVDYFLIKVEVTNKDTIDTQKNRFYQIFTYVVTPFKIHYTKLAGYTTEKFNFEKVKDKFLILREYNYVYTGKNIDVLDFKIRFDNSFYTVIAKAMGKTDLPGSRLTAANNGTESPAFIKRDPAVSTDSIPSSPVYVDSTISVNTDHQALTGALTGGQPLVDPYYIMSKAMYDAVVNSKSDMIMLDLGILGDPFYLASGGIGNYTPKSSNGITEDGAVDRNHGMALVRITFKNPEDIGTDGFVRFNDQHVSFNGVYLIKRVVSKFASGTFKQKLELARMIQTPPKSTVTTKDVATVLTQNPQINDTTEVTDSASTPNR